MQGRQTSSAARFAGVTALAGNFTVICLLLACSTPDPVAESLAETVPLTLETIFERGGGAGSAVIAPDGRWAAVVARAGGGPGIYLVPTAVGALPASRLLMRGGSPVWSPDGARLAFVADGELRATVVDGGAAEEAPESLASGLPGLRSPAWSPDGQQLAFYTAASGRQDLWLVASSGESEPSLLAEGVAEADDTRFAPSWSPDGRFIAYVSNEADWWHDDVWLVEVSTGRKTRVSSTLMASSSPVFSPSGTSLVLMATAKDGYWYQDLADLFRIDLDLGAARPMATSEEPIEMQVYASDFIMRFDPYWSADGEQVFFPYHQRGAFDLWAVPASGGVASRVTSVGGAWSSLDATPDGSRAVFVRDAATEGREVWLADAAGGTARPLTHFSPRFEGLQVPIEVAFRSFDGLYLQGFLYLPSQLRAGLERGTGSAMARLAAVDAPSCPALVQVHGGGTNSYYQGSNLIEQYLARQGFVVLAINYRGGSGFGREFQDLSVEDWLNDQSRDPGAAADWLRSQPWVNGKVGIYGGSYGGMQSMSAITRTPDKFDAAVPMRGIYSEAKTLEDADRLGKIFTITGHGGTPEERPEIYEKSETLARMDRITAPVLMMHGERDVRAPFSNFLLAKERLEELGKELETRTYPEGHGFRDPANSIDMYSRLEEFFRRHLGECR